MFTCLQTDRLDTETPIGNTFTKFYIYCDWTWIAYNTFDGQ